MVLSYEMFLQHYKKIEEIPFDLMVCDEAHRLKNSENKIYSAVSTLPVKFRIFLTGTPIQNNIKEFCSLVDLVDKSLISN